MFSNHKQLSPILKELLKDYTIGELMKLFRERLSQEEEGSDKFNYHRDCYYCLIYDTRTGLNSELIEVLYYFGYRPDLEEEDIYKRKGSSNIKLTPNFTYLELVQRLVSAETEKLTKWNKTEESLPHAYQTGDWDGKRSDQVMIQLKDNIVCIGVLYEGVIDGEEFQDWYSIDAEGREWDRVNPLYWRKIY